MASASFVPVRRITMGTVDLELPRGGHDAVGHVVGSRDAAENIEEDRFDVGIAGDDLERGNHFLGIRAAADVEEVGRISPVELDQIHRGHGESRAVHHAADIAIELDERQVGPPRRRLARLLRRVVTQQAEIRAPEQLVVVDHDLGVEREHVDRPAS